jgi:hypothetical protein
MPVTPDIIEEHIDEGVSFPALARRHGVSQTTAVNHFQKAATTELEALEAMLEAGGIHFSVPTGDIEEFRRLTRRVLWVVTELYEKRGIRLSIRTKTSDEAVHYEMRLV